MAKALVSLMDLQEEMDESAHEAFSHPTERVFPQQGQTFKGVAKAAKSGVKKRVKNKRKR